MRNLKTSYFITLWRCTLNAYFVITGAQKSNQITNSMAISSLYCHWIYSYVHNFQFMTPDIPNFFWTCHNFSFSISLVIANDACRGSHSCNITFKFKRLFKWLYNHHVTTIQNASMAIIIEWMLANMNAKYWTMAGFLAERHKILDISWKTS